MNTISSSSNYSVSASTNNGFSGMVSGMDTEGLVKKMLSGTQSKIDKQSGQKQVVEWKQDIYRDAVSNINKFQTKFFDFTSNSNLMSNTFFNQMKSTSTSSAFRVTGSSNAIAGNTSISIEQLASSTRLEGISLSSSNAINGTFNSDAFNPRVSFDVAAVTGDTPKQAATVSLSIADIENIIKGIAVPKALINADGTTSTETVSFSVNNGSLTINGGGRSISVKGSTGEAGGTTALGLERLGLRGGMTSSLTDGTITSKVNKDAVPKFEISLDGIKKTIEIEVGETKDSLQDKLNFAFGKDTVAVNGTDLSAFSLTTGEGRKIIVGGSSSGLEAMGVIDGQSNTVAMGDTLENVLGAGLFDATTGKASFSINDKLIEVLKDETISSFMKKINTSDADVKIEYSELKNQFVMSRNSSGAGFDIKVDDTNGLLGKVFGTTFDADGHANDVIDKDGKTVETYKLGENAIVTINGVETDRSTNNFTINGLNFELLDETTQTETISTTRNTETIFDGIKLFVDEYNTMIKGLNGLVDEKQDYKDYPPLTDDQRKEMSKTEIDAWEKKAKTGLLRGDNDISSFLSQMRLALYQKPADAKYALFDIGIETSKEWKDSGKLVINEDQLKKMINSEPTAIQELFTYSKTKLDENGNTVSDGIQGIATALKDIIKTAANTSSGSPGTLVKLAGVEGFATEKDNILSKQMEKMNDKIKSLKVSYEKEKSRYWRQFNEMEKVLANLSAQSGWLTQQLG